MRKRNKLMAVWCTVFLVAGGLMATAGVASAITTLNFSNLANTSIEFLGTGDTFSFIPETSGYDFMITDETGGSAANGLFGTISGTFTIGTIFNDIPGKLESALATGPGTITITDADSKLLTATVNWFDIYTYMATGGLNSEALVNLSGISYSGSNPDLQAFAASGDGIGTVTFQFGAKTLLSHLTEDGLVHSTSYSGSLTYDYVPLPGSVLLLGSGILGLVGLGWRRARRES